VQASCIHLECLTDYACDIQRQAEKQTDSSENFYLNHVAPVIKKSGIDKWIKSVSDITKLTSENIEKSLACHKNAVDMFKSITRDKERSLTSLASKYLHFHASNAFFIYDSRAKKEVANLVKLPRNRTHPDFCDGEYADFCARCLIYRDELQKSFNDEVTPRILDMKLLGY